MDYLDGGSCTNHDIRMIRNNTGIPFKSNGRIEVCYNNQWGSICNNSWGTNDAKVACGQLGYTKSGTCCISVQSIKFT